MSEKRERSKLSPFETELDKIQTDLQHGIQEADDISEKIAVYKETIQKYERLKGSFSSKSEDLDRINKTIQYLQRRIQIFENFARERKETLPTHPKEDLEITWMDDKHDVYLSNFISRHPHLAEEFSSEIQASMETDQSSTENLGTRIQLYGKLIGRTQKAIDRYRRLDRAISKLKRRRKTNTEKFRQLTEERRRLGNPKSLKRFRKKFAIMKVGLQTASKAYERFTGERAQIEQNILDRIASGEIEYAEQAPYILFVNKAKHEQYVLAYKYDKTQNKLTLKSFNLLSTGSATRYPRKDHTTLSNVYYIRHIFSPKAKGYNSAWGSKHVRRDQEAYKIFQLRFKDKGGKFIDYEYFMHLTPEESKFGTPQSHGCLRIPRMFNLDVNEIYLREFQKAAATNPQAYDPYIRGFQSTEYTRVYEPSFRIPIVVADLMNDKYETVFEEYKETDTSKMTATQKIAFHSEIRRKFLEVAAEAREAIRKMEETASRTKHDSLSKKYYEKHLKRSLAQAKDHERFILQLEKVKVKEGIIGSLMKLKSECGEIKDDNVRKMLTSNIDHYGKT